MKKIKIYLMYLHWECPICKNPIKTTIGILRGKIPEGLQYSIYTCFICKTELRYENLIGKKLSREKAIFIDGVYISDKIWKDNKFYVYRYTPIHSKAVISHYNTNNELYNELIIDTVSYKIEEIIEKTLRRLKKW